MRMKAADYMADMLVKHEIAHVFTVTGGGAMHFNHAFGHKEGLTCIYQHHEQACAMAAESYARIRGRMAAVCVTTGPGGTNALTGVLGSWLDSIPMLVISGQVRTDMTARSTGLGIRALGDQEFDITRAVSCMTKYAVMVTRPEDIRYCLEKALFFAKSGRPGPCWLDIPLDVQAAWLQTDELAGYDPANDPDYLRVMPPAVTDETADRIIQKVRSAKRPVLHAGNGVRIAGAQKLLLEVAEKLRIPVVTGWNSIDLIADEHPLYAGRAGIMGDRPGNWAIQCSDVLLSVGSRLSVRQVGYAQGTWARDACTIVQDIDNEELKKPNIHVDMPVWADAYALLKKLNRRLSGEPSADASAPHPQGNAGEADDAAMPHQAWIQKCRSLREQYPVVLKKHFKKQPRANVYALIHTLSKALPKGRTIVVGNGSASVAGSHAFVIKQGQRFLINSGAASMGYDLPAAVGACIASGYAEVTCLTGDGSIQMNLQELQTIIHHRMPIKIFVINNEGYHSIRQTQRNYFKEPLVGVGTDSADLSFPSMEKLAWAYGFPYYKIETNDHLPQITEILEKEGFCICEIFVDTKQCFEPKSASEQLADGRMLSLPLEDLAPRLSEEELRDILRYARETDS